MLGGGGGVVPCVGVSTQRTHIAPYWIAFYWNQLQTTNLSQKPSIVQKLQINVTKEHTIISTYPLGIECLGL